MPTNLQLVGMRRNGYENSNRDHAKASFLSTGLHTVSMTLSHEKHKPSLSLRYLIDPLDLPCRKVFLAVLVV
jgi:hypothetical protein